jgi:hypothetical protein
VGLLHPPPDLELEQAEVKPARRAVHFTDSPDHDTSSDDDNHAPGPGAAATQPPADWDPYTSSLPLHPGASSATFARI